MCTRPETVRTHLRRLRGWGYELVTFGDLAAAAEAGQGGGLAALTFDDGFAGVLDHLLPLLQLERAPATVFVVTGWLGSPHPDAPWARVLDGSEVRQLHAHGLEIGSHTVTHRNLATLTPEDAYQELLESRLALEGLLDAEVRVAAYPYGAATLETRRACRRAGYVAACRFRGAGSWADPFDLPRQPVGLRTSSLALRLKRDDRYERICRIPAVQAVRALAWRVRA